MDFCQEYGEFLTIKIENMSVQNIQKERNAPKTQKFLFDPEREMGNFALVAVATNVQMQQMLFDMGADVVIMSEVAPSSQDFIDAFDCADAEQILVFPNSSNSILTCMQAGSLYKRAKVTVLNSRSLAHCYAALAVLDLEGSLGDAVDSANDTISNMYQLSVYRAAKDIKFGNKRVAKNAFFALANNKILHTADTLEDVALYVVCHTMEREEYAVVTLFYGSDVAQEYMEYLTEKIQALGLDVEVATVATGESMCELTLTFE